MIEEWRAIPSSPAYDASSLGNIRRAAGGSGSVIGRVLKQVEKNGYLCVSIGRKRLQKYVHRLVAEAFHGQPFDGAEAAHKDGQKYNNASCNLRWATSKQNADDREYHGTTAKGERCGAARISSVIAGKIRVATGSVRSIAREFNISPSQVHRIRSGGSWRHTWQA